MADTKLKETVAAPQSLLMPWAQKKWGDIKRRLSKPCASVVELESMMSAARIKQRRVIDLFTLLYGDESMCSKLPQRDHFITVVVPWMQTLVIGGPKVFTHPITLMSTPSVVSMTRVQAATLLACMFFGLVGLTKGPIKAINLPETTFKHIFENQRPFPLQCLIGFFTYVHSLATSIGDAGDIYRGGVLVAKRVSGEPVAWATADVPLCDVAFGSNVADNNPAKMHLVSTDAIIGGDNIFGGSLTPEQVILLARPEALALAVLNPQLGPTDALTIMGAEKINAYGGLGASVIYMGLHVDPTPRGYSADDCEVMTQCALVFVDASTGTSGKSQFIESFMRDLNKAYFGMTALKWSEGTRPVFAADPWRNGFIGNNIHLKFIQVWLAASAAGCQLTYHATSDDLEESASDFVAWALQDEMSVMQMLAQYAIVATSVKSVSRLAALDIFTAIMEN